MGYPSAAAIPDRDLDRSISHLLSTAQVNTAHLQVHSDAAQASVGNAVLVTHHLRHSLDHVRGVSSHLVKLRDAVARRLPGVARELESLDGAFPGERSAVGDVVPRAALDMSIAHDLAEAQSAAAHVDRHLVEAQLAQSAGNRPSVTFNIEHATHHVAEIAHNLDELQQDLFRRLPSVGGETAKLHAATDLEEKPMSGGRSAPADYDASFRGPVPALSVS